jgi:hypothetical protein
MSRFDHTTFARLAGPLQFQRPAVTFAANSIKLHFVLASARADRYIWIDPPWQLHRNGQLLLDSFSYPDPRSALGRREERTWLRRAGWFRPGAFLSLSRQPDQLVWFRFANGWSILAPGAASRRDLEQWYDDWYIADSRVPADASLQRSREPAG